jgi:aspartate--ammonia ligase
MEKLFIPPHYFSPLSLYQTEEAIKQIKDLFQKELSANLHLKRCTAPLFLDARTGLNDNLNGVERPVSFTIKDHPEAQPEVVQSLAKWKRYALGRYGFGLHEGLYTDMNAIRRDEDLDNIHSVYVDQWDWEKVIAKDDRTLAYLEETVREIYAALVKTEEVLSASYSYIQKILPPELTFIESEALLQRYPGKSPKERERLICLEKKAVFIERIGWPLSDGHPHDGRAPDYDDWNLNGDLLVYDSVLDLGLELSSMGVRVDAAALQKQLAAKGNLGRLSLPFQQAVLKGRVPFSIGGGIGQSRLCMYFLRKAHIGEVQSSLWSEETIEKAKENGIILL